MIEIMINNDACSFSYGVETVGGVMSVLIKKYKYKFKKDFNFFHI